MYLEVLNKIKFSITNDETEHVEHVRKLWTISDAGYIWSLQ